MTVKLSNKKIMILGGYGTFGSRIAKQLAQYDCALIIVGRNLSKAQKLQIEIKKSQPQCKIELAIFDVHSQLEKNLKLFKPTILIHTCGPFQGQQTTVAETCIRQGVHYIDLADGRDFVKSILQLDNSAKQNKVVVITAASTVPTLSSAVIQHYMDSENFVEFTAINYGVTPGQKTDRGLATTQAVLSYLGKPIRPWQQEKGTRFGWQDIYKQNYPELGNRLMGNCEIPDLDLLAQYFPIKKIHFAAGMESKALHLCLWVLSGLVRIKLPVNLKKHAKILMKIGRLFDVFGTHDGGMHMHLQGYDKSHKIIKKSWYIIAKNADGPMIPAIPAVIMALKILNKDYVQTGVNPCIGIVSLEEYMQALTAFDIRTIKNK
ncbi:MAG: saccharopine dehydrogenase NADP-binding domain-containing protein [Proteobacteria bacterium]|nr:saccharopine dehydrogenase NADP-binding domain-containing protein [Pseudomonadota bacterium]